MAKRVPLGEKPYRPVDEALVRAVMHSHPVAVGENTAPTPLPETRPPGPRLGALSGKEEGGAGKEQPAPVPELEKLSREKRLLLSPSEEREVERLVADMAAELGTPLKASHVLRATVTLLRHAREELIKQSRRVGPLKRPPNGDAAALAAFEHSLAQLIDTALRNSLALE